MKKTLAVLLFALCFLACRSVETIGISQSNLNTSGATRQPSKDIDPSAQKSAAPKPGSDGEISGCSPEKLSSGSKILVALKSPNGGYLAIKREAKKPDYFLLSAPENSKDQEFAARADSLPFWQVETLKTLNRIELDPAQARAVNLSKLNTKGEGTAELIFSRAGWYEILLSNENFEQDDPIITGRCRVYFDKTKTPAKIAQSSKSVNGEVINWKSETANLYFEAALSIKDGRPVAFSLNGYRIIRRKDFETANDCDFTVEKDKDNSVWQTNDVKTIISGRDEAGKPFQMFIAKTLNGFLIDTSAAAENCFNVGMPGNILLTKEGDKYSGKFVALGSNNLIN